MRPAPALLLPLLLALPLSAQGFRWSLDADRPGPVELLDTSGWSEHAAGGFHYRSVPSWTDAPTYELYFAPPASGHATLAERALVQVPLGFGDRPRPQRAAVVAFHGAGRSEKEVFVETELPRECARRGWLLVAPYGLTDSHFANQASQEALAAVMAGVEALAPFERRRVYAVGCAMGGLSALNFAMRHQDPRGLRVAGVVCHSPTLDLAAEWRRASGRERVRIATSIGGTPREVPRAYERISPARFSSQGLVDPRRSPVVQLEGMLIYLCANLADPEVTRPTEVQELRAFLNARGARVVEGLVFQPGVGGGWSSLPLGHALDLLSEQLVHGVPRVLEVFADRPGTYGAAVLRRLGEGTHGRFRLSLADPDERENSVALEGTVNVEEVAIDPGLAELDPTRPVTLRWSSADGTADRVVLRGYPRMPAQVTIDGGRPSPRVWAWISDAGEVRLDLPSSDRTSVVVVTP